MAFVVQLILPVYDHMEIDVANAYSRPWKADTMRFTWQPDTELLEHLCESNRDLANIQRFRSGQEQAQPSADGKR